ncbi:hypothetical protein PTKIN_Ptkin11bG0025700 [Pterospermum kingtungense]
MKNFLVEIPNPLHRFIPSQYKIGTQIPFTKLVKSLKFVSKSTTVFVGVNTSGSCPIYSCGAWVGQPKVCIRRCSLGKIKS